MTACPACRWENDADSGPCAGCGRELSPSEPPRTPAADPVAEPTSQPLGTVSADGAWPEATAGLLRPQSHPVTIRPSARPTPQVVDPVHGAARSVDPPRTAPRAPAEATPARAAPAQVRSIPVVVGSAGGRPAVRRRGNGSDDDAVLDSAPATVPSLGRAGEGLCPSCGRSVAADQHFCRCGAELSRTRRQAERTTMADAAGMSRQAFLRAQRRANGGRRVRYDEPLSPRTWLVRVVGVLALVGALGSQAPPWGDDVRSWMQTRTASASPWW